MCHWLLISSVPLQFLCSNQFFLLILVILPYSSITLAARSRNRLLSWTSFMLRFIFMENSTSWKANRSSTSQEILRLFGTLSFHYLFQKCPSPVPILSQITPVHATPSNTLKIYFTIILLYARIRSSSHASRIMTCTNICLFYLWDLKFHGGKYEEFTYFVKPYLFNLWTFRARTLHLSSGYRAVKATKFWPFAGHSQNCNHPSSSRNFAYFYSPFLCSVFHPFHSLFSFSVLMLDVAGSSTLLIFMYQVTRHLPPHDRNPST